MPNLKFNSKQILSGLGLTVVVGLVAVPSFLPEPVQAQTPNASERAQIKQEEQRITQDQENHFIAEQQAQAIAEQNFDHAMYSQVKTIQNAIGLSDETLAAMGCNQEKAETVLTQIKQWCQVNAQQVQAAKQQQIQAQRKVQTLLKQINMGANPRNSQVGQVTRPQANTEAMQALPEANREAMTKAKAYSDLMNHAKQTIKNQLNSMQNKVWDTALKNRNLSRELRYVPDMGQTQHQAIGKIKKEERQRQKIKRNGGTINTFETRQTVKDVLSYSQKQEASQCETNVVVHRNGIVKAAAKVFEK